MLAAGVFSMLLAVNGFRMDTSAVSV